MPEVQTLLTGLAFGESPRWHEDRLWFSNWGTQEVVAVDLEGKSEVMVRVPTTIPFSIDWLPDGLWWLLGASVRKNRHLKNDLTSLLAKEGEISVK